MNTRPERPTCFLHIGPPKTGSSTISHFTEGNRDALAAQGLYVPNMPSLEGRPEIGHGMFAKVDEIDWSGDLKPGARLWPEIEEVARRGEQNIVLTNEAFAFSLRDRDTVDRIVSYFEKRGYGVTVIAYLRDQPSSLNSSYVQTQKRLYARQTFQEYVDECAEKGRVDPWRLLQHMIDDPRVTVDVGSFETVVKSGLEEDFARRIGLLDISQMARAPSRNPNAGVKTVYAAQQIMNRTGGAMHKLASYKQIYRRFRRHFESLDWENEPYIALDQPTYARIREHYRDGNERFAQRFLGRSWSEIAPDRAYEKKVFDPKRASRAELAEIDKVVDEAVELITKARALEAGGEVLQLKKRKLMRKSPAKRREAGAERQD